jgi:hypothetical protein
MRLTTLAATLVALALYLIVSVGNEVFVDDVIRPRSLFFSLLIGTVLATFLVMPIDIDIPN